MKHLTAKIIIAVLFIGAVVVLNLLLTLIEML